MAIGLNITATLTSSQLRNLITKAVEEEHPDYKVTTVTFECSTGGNFGHGPELRTASVSLVKKASAS